MYNRIDMALKQRREVYKQIEESRGNPLIVYITSQRQGANGSMAGDVIDEFIAQIDKIDAESKAVDLLIESTGGDALTAWRIISLLRTRFEKVSVLIPHSAFSAATLLSLGADEIVMGPYSSLGPIDPQITTRKKDGSVQNFGYEDVASFLDFVREEGKITEQEHVRVAIDKLCESVEPPVLGFAKRSSSLSISIGAKMLQMHMTESEDKAQAHAIATKLNKSFFNHGHALSRKEAQEIGLNIVIPEAELEQLMWSIHLDFAEELNTRTPFDPLAYYLQHPDASSLLNSPPPIHIPPQIPQQLALQMLQDYLNQQVNTNMPSVEVELRYAFVESARFASEFFVRNQILVERVGNLQFNGNMVALEQSWRNVIIEETPEPAAAEEATQEEHEPTE